jgi:copper chaperone CopZ
MADCPVCELHAESVFKIEGMDCHEEVAILEHRLKTLAGLEALDADVVGQRLRIQYDAAKLTTSRIAEAVAQTGMRAGSSARRSPSSTGACPARWPEPQGPLSPHPRRRWSSENRVFSYRSPFFCFHKLQGQVPRIAGSRSPFSRAQSMARS